MAEFISVKRERFGVSSYKGKKTYQNDSGTLVKRKEDGGWGMVEPQDNFVSNDELVESYGFWNDSKNVERQLPKTRLRDYISPRTEMVSNGLIEDEEVLPFKPLPFKKFVTAKCGKSANQIWHNDYSWNWHDQQLILDPVKRELELTKDGATLDTEHTNWGMYNRHDYKSEFAGELFTSSRALTWSEDIPTQKDLPRSGTLSHQRR